MLSYEPEIDRLRDAGAIRAETAGALGAIERRERFSLYWEIRIASYVAVLLIAAGAGVFVKNNYEQIGPLAVIAVVGLAAAGCYAFAFSRLRRAAEESAAADYVLLLGALLLSADVGFAESQYHLLGDSWPRHFLFLAAIHAVTAYRFRSRMVLTVAITALTAWFGIEQNVKTLFDSTAETGGRAIVCAAVIFAWRHAHAPRSRIGEFVPVFDHAMTNLAMWGALIWCFDDAMRWPGLALLGVLAFLSLQRAFATKEEPFALYGGIYFYIGASAVIVHLVTRWLTGDARDVLFFLYFLATIPALVTALMLVHFRFLRASR